MSSCKPLLAACCLLLAASTASASVLYRGLSHTPTGSSSLTVTPEQKLHIENIGSSGQDGVDISCAGLDGVRLPVHGTLYQATDAGSSVSLTYRWHVVGMPTGSRSMSLSCAVSSSSLELSSSNPFTLSSSSRVRCFSNGAVVLDVSNPPSSSASVVLAPGGSCPTPSLSCALDRASGEQRCVAEFSSSQAVSVGGVVVVCDAVMFSGDDDEDCDGSGDDAEMRVTSPPGSSLSSLECDRVDFVSFGQFMCGEGQVVVDPPGGTLERRLPVRNLGSSGEDGVSVQRAPGSGGGGGGCGAMTCGLSGLVDLQFAMPSLLFDPRTDDGAACVTRVLGSSSSQPGGLLGSVRLTVIGRDFSISSDFSGMAAEAESCIVLDRGVEVYRGALASGVPVVVEPPPGDPVGMAIGSKGAPAVKESPKKKTSQLPQQGPGDGAGRSAAESFSDLEYLPLEVSFHNSRVFVFGGLRVTGDQFVCWGEKSSASGTGALHVVSQQCLFRCPSSGAPSSVELLGAASSSGDLVGPEVAASTALSSSSTCVDVPFTISRVDATPARAFTVTFHLSPELAVCPSSVTEGDYLSRSGPTQMFVLNNGGGSYTVDCGVLGTVCGTTGDGTLFALHLSAVQPATSSYGQVVVDQVSVRDCSNGDVPASPGAPGHVPIDFTAPPAVTTLAVTQVRSGNDGDGTCALHVTRPVADPVTAIDLYRKPFGNYPEYDDAPGAGSAPSPPSSPADALAHGWVLADLDGDGREDLGSSRDVQYFVVFARDQFGNTSPVSNRTDGTPNYFLGDVSNGLATCTGDNLVGPEDISLLGAHYGASVSPGSSFACLDVGPTSNRSVEGRPLTDNRVSFEDFMMFAMNYGAVSAPRFVAVPAAAAANVASLEAPKLPEPGATFEAVLRIEGAGDIQALSAKLDYDAAVIEQVGVASGELLGAQGRDALVLSSAPGVVDAAVLGAGSGLSGAGELARVTFRVKAAGDARLALASVTARDGENRAVAIALGGTPGGAARTGLANVYPNPFDQATEVRFGMPVAAPVTLGVYDVAGRRVRTLLRGVQPAGERSVTWNGRDDGGLRLAPGAYVLRFESGGRSETRIVKLVR